MCQLAYSAKYSKQHIYTTTHASTGLASLISEPTDLYNHSCIKWPSQPNIRTNIFTQPLMYQLAYSAKYPKQHIYTTTHVSTGLASLISEPTELYNHACINWPSQPNITVIRSNIFMQQIYSHCFLTQRRVIMLHHF